VREGDGKEKLLSQVVDKIEVPAAWSSYMTPRKPMSAVTSDMRTTVTSDDLSSSSSAAAYPALVHLDLNLLRHRLV
jgi:hypothetical protein